MAKFSGKSRRSLTTIVEVPKLIDGDAQIEINAVVP